MYAPALRSVTTPSSSSKFLYITLHFIVLSLIFCRHISNVPHSRGWERKISEGPPCVVLASPGFMDSGPSRELLELWAPDSRNGVILTGYSIEGTMARVSGYAVSRRVCHVVYGVSYCMYIIAKQCTCSSRPTPFGLLELSVANRPLNSCSSLGYPNRAG